MIRFSFYRDISNPDPKKHKRIKGLIITIGRRCISSCYCDKASKCRYRSNFQFDNYIVRLRNWIFWKFHIRVPQIIFIGKRDVDLSGTTKCPFQKPRRYTCWDCEHSYGMENCRIEWQYRKDNPDKDWKHDRCGSYEPNKYADCWDRKTGERIY